MSSGVGMIEIETLDESQTILNIKNNNNSTLENTFLSEHENDNDSKNNDIEKGKGYLYDEKVYGNDIKIENPKKLGKTFAFLYFRKHPIIVIGPDCNF
jgi:hypothetical protein